MKYKKNDGNIPVVRISDLRGVKYRQSLEALFVDGIQMSVKSSLAVISEINKANIPCVVIGGIVVGCHTGRPRATQDLDLIVDHEPGKAVLNRIGKIVGAEKVEKYDSFLSFVVDSPIGSREIVDLITSKAGSYGMVFDNYLEIMISGVSIKIPTVEMMIVLKHTAAVNPIRTKSKQAQDWADIFAMLDVNKKINVQAVIRMANSVVPGFGDDLKRAIRNHCG